MLTIYIAVGKTYQEKKKKQKKKKHLIIPSHLFKLISWPISAYSSTAILHTTLPVLASERQNYRPVHAELRLNRANSRAYKNPTHNQSLFTRSDTLRDTCKVPTRNVFPIYFNLFIRSFSNNYCLVFACSAGEVFIGCCDFFSDRVLELCVYCVAEVRKKKVYRVEQHALFYDVVTYRFLWSRTKIGSWVCKVQI